MKTNTQIKILVIGIILAIAGGLFLRSKTTLFGAGVYQVVQGGTGASTFTTGECLKGNGTSAITTGACGGAGGGGSQFSTSTPDTTGVYLNVATKLGIGTTSPYAPMSVVGKLGVVAAKFHATSTTATSTFSGGLTTGTSGLNVLVNGRVGINTIAPSTYLTVKGAGSSGASMTRFNAGSGNSFVQINDNGTMVIDGDVGTGSFPLTLKLNGSTVMTFSSGGNISANTYGSVKAGTASVSIGSGAFTGDSGYWQLRSSTDHSINFDTYNSNSPINVMTILQTGRIGIGTSTPKANLQVTHLTANSTTTLDFGRAGQNKGTCMKLYDEVGTAYYLKVAGGALNLSTTNCASVSGF